MGHALEGGLLDLADLVLVDAQLLQALGHVGGHVLEHVLGQVETLQLGQRGQGFGVDHGDFVVHEDQGLKERKGAQMHPHSGSLGRSIPPPSFSTGLFWFELA